MENLALQSMNMILKRLNPGTKLKIEFLMGKELSYDKYLIDICDRYGPNVVVDHLEHIVKKIDLNSIVQMPTTKVDAKKYQYENNCPPKFKWDKLAMDKLGFTLIEEVGGRNDGWSRWKGHNFEVHMFLHPNLRVPKQENSFTFKALGNRYWKGNFKVQIESVKEFELLLKMLNNAN